MIIYKATNKTNGISYIGQTVQKLEERIKRHLNGRKTYFCNALKKYGVDRFEWIILEECDSKEQMDEMEFHYIKQYDTYDNGYNLTYGGDSGTLGYTHTEKTKEKMRKPKSMEHRRNLSKAAKNRKMSKKEREHLSEIFSGKGNPMYGKKHSIESIQKMSEKSKERFSDVKNVPMYGRTGEKNPCFNKSNNTWKIIYPNGDEVIVENGLGKFCRDYEKETGIKLYASNFSHVVSGRVKSYKGLICEKII